MDKHCKDCIWHANAKNNQARFMKYNDWCAEIGNAASKVIGHCKLKGLKKTGESK